jgi:hypothetical protein
LGLARCLAGSLVPILGGLVANQTQNSSHNIGNDELLGLSLDQATAGAGNIIDEAIDVVPSRAGDDLEEDVGGSNSAGLGALNLASLEEAK